MNQTTGRAPLASPPSAVGPSAVGPLAGIVVVSLGLLAGLVWLIYFNKAALVPAAAVAFLPAVNATLNALAAAFLVRGLIAIHRGERERHERLMKSAFVFSALFLSSYLVYHAAHGNTPFQGQGLIRPVYFSVLISHIVLSAVALPLILTTFYFSLTGRFAAHRRIARVTFPIWLYVSVTGVLIFVLLKLFG